MTKKYIVTLTTEERQELFNLISRGKAPARKIARAHILLKADQAKGRTSLTDEKIAEALDVSVRTIERVRKLFVEEGPEAALNQKERSTPRPRKLDGRQEAYLIAMACGDPPEGQGRWTLRLLADKMVKLQYVESISHETVRQVLKK